MATPLTFLRESLDAGKRNGDIAGRVLSWALAIAMPVALLAIPLIVTTTRTPEDGVLPPAAAAAVGVWSGEYVDGVPLYRLPPVTVVAEPDRTWAIAREGEPQGAASARASRNPAMGIVSRTTDTRAN